MINILVINGPNLNLLGFRDPAQYGTVTLKEISAQLCAIAQNCDCHLVFYQSNHEGKIIDFLQKESSRRACGILINPGALTHYGYSLRDALADMELPIVEVHLSDISRREDFRKIDVLEGISNHVVMGHKDKSYYLGLKKLIERIKKL